MRFMGIGTLELVMIVLVGFLLVGPTDMVRLARRAGTFLRQLKSSEIWQSVQGSTRSIKRMGRELLEDDAMGLDSIRQELKSVDLTGGVDPAELAKMPGWKPKVDAFSYGEDSQPDEPAEAAAEAAPAESQEQSS